MDRRSNRKCRPRKVNLSDQNRGTQEVPTQTHEKVTEAKKWTEKVSSDGSLDGSSHSKTSNGSHVQEVVKKRCRRKQRVASVLPSMKRVMQQTATDEKERDIQTKRWAAESGCDVEGPSHSMSVCRVQEEPKSVPQTISCSIVKHKSPSNRVKDQNPPKKPKFADEFAYFQSILREDCSELKGLDRWKNVYRYLKRKVRDLKYLEWQQVDYAVKNEPLPLNLAEEVKKKVDNEDIRRFYWSLICPTLAKRCKWDEISMITTLDEKLRRLAESNMSYRNRGGTKFENKHC